MNNNNNLNQYMFSQYKNGSRGEQINGITYYDCWGIVRAIRHEYFNLSLMPSWGLVDCENKRETTKAWHEAERILNPVSPCISSIACVFHKELMLHVGIVVQGDRGLSVLETTPETGPRILTIKDFEQFHSSNGMHVEYWI